MTNFAIIDVDIGSSNLLACFYIIKAYVILFSQSPDIFMQVSSVALTLICTCIAWFNVSVIWCTVYRVYFSSGFNFAKKYNYKMAAQNIF